MYDQPGFTWIETPAMKQVFFFHESLSCFTKNVSAIIDNFSKEIHKSLIMNLNCDIGINVENVQITCCMEVGSFVTEDFLEAIELCLDVRSAFSVIDFVTLFWLTRRNMLS